MYQRCAQAADKKMSDQIVNKLGLQIDDFDETINSKDELIESVLSSAILSRKAVTHIVFNNFRVYFENPDLKPSDRLKDYFNYGERESLWIKFRDSFEFNIPRLKTSKWTTRLIFIYIVVYLYFSVKVHSLYSITIIDSTLRKGIASIFAVGLIFPIGLILHFGERELPAKNFEELIEQIMQEYIYDLLTDDKKRLRELLTKELNVD
jgi:hypothetical protein